MARRRKPGNQSPAPIPGQSGPAIDQQSAVVAQSLTVSAKWQGPLPHPNDLARFNAVIPNGADRIVTRWEEQGRHRQELETFVIHHDSARADRGQTYAFVIGIFGLLVAGFLGYVHEGAAASVIGGGGLASLTGGFIVGQITRRNERKDRMRALGIKTEK